MNIAGAQDLKVDSKLPAAMEQAIARIAKGWAGAVDPGGGAVPAALTAKGAIAATGINPLMFTQAPNAPPDGQVCSAPLLEMQIDRPERFTMLRVAPGPSVDRMPRAIAPAPPCQRDRN